MYVPSANAISNLVLDVLVKASYLPNLKEALIPVFKDATVATPTLHKCKTFTGSLIILDNIVVGIWLVIVNGASLWL